MARSVGEAAATGLESGITLGLGIANQRRQQARQDTLDASAAEDRQRGIERQRNADTLGALNEQEKQLTAEGTAMVNSETPPTPEAQQDFAGRAQGLRRAKNDQLAKISGFVTNTKKAADVDLQTLNTGDVSKVGNLTRAITVGTGQNPSVYIRQGDAPSPIEQAGQAMLEGIQGGDQAKVVAGANVLFAPKLNVGIGETSPHGGRIVKKEIINIVPAPGGDPNDPKFIPVLRVYVKKDGTTGPGDPDKGGATGHYDAPLTEGRSSAPDAKVKALGLKDVMDFVGHNLHIAELLNQPEGQAKLQQDQQSADQFNPQDYLSALQQMGVQSQPKVVVKETVIPAGGTLQRTVTNARTGAVVSQSSTQGNSKINPADKLTLFSDGIDKQVEQGVMSEEDGAQLKSDFATRQARGAGDATMESKLRQIDDDESLSADQKAEQRKAVLSGIRPTAARGGSTANGDARTADRKLGRQLQTMKDARIEIDAKRTHALHEYQTAIKDETNKKVKADAKAIYDKKIGDLESDDADLKSRMKKINDQMDTADDGDAPDKPAPGLGAARTADGAPRASSTKVAPADQKAKDTDRVRILNDELAKERDKLTTQEGNKADQDTITRTRGNVAALEREIAGTQRGLGSARRASDAAPVAKPGLVLKFDKNGQRVSN